MALNLEKQLVFYGAYHHNSVNVGVHIVCVPILMFTYFLFTTNTPALPLPSALAIPNLPYNLAFGAMTLYSTLYILMEPVAGALIAPIIIGGTAYANHLTSTYGITASYYALGVHIVSWIAQFVGHGKFEGRAPALLDNLVQALFLAPFFVWFEILFFFGYRPELKNRIDLAVQKQIQKFKENQSKGEASNGVANGTK